MAVVCFRPVLYLTEKGKKTKQTQNNGTLAFKAKQCAGGAPRLRAGLVPEDGLQRTKAVAMSLRNKTTPVGSG